MKRSLIIPVSLFILLFLYSCVPDYFSKQRPELVVEGWIENDRPPVVILTKTLILSDKYQSLADLKDYIITWAKVSISDGKDTVVLTGKYAPEYFPPYIYTSGKMFGEIGRTYYLIVEYEDFYVTSETSILPPPIIDKYKVVPSADSDSFYQIEVSVKDENPETDYYQGFTKIGTSSKQYQSSYLGTFSDEVLSKGEFIPIFRGKSAMDEEYTFFFRENDSVSVKIAHIDKGGYNFWSTYSKNITMPSNMFLTAISRVPSNIKGGLGYWCGMGSTIKNIVVSEHIDQVNGD